MDKEPMFIARVLEDNGDVKVERYIIGRDKLDTCISVLKHDYPNRPVYVNKAVICFDGYLTNGDYMGEF